MNVHESHEHIEEVGAHHGNKRVALLIALLAAVLAITEMGGRNAEVQALGRNIEASNLWAFFQAKTIRQTTLRTAAEAFEIAGLSPEQTDAVNKKIQAWRATADRYESEPSTNEGRRELAARAKHAEHERDQALAAHHAFEVGSGALQLAIVLASASVVAGVMALAWAGGVLGLIGFGFALIGWFAPTALHALHLSH
jgi:hypothetical protein